MLQARMEPQKGQRLELIELLYQEMRMEYTEGWQFGGEDFDIRIAPWEGTGFDPQRLVGCHVHYYEVNGAGHVNGPFGRGLIVVDRNGSEVEILVKARSLEGSNSDCWLDVDVAKVDWPDPLPDDGDMDCRPFTPPKKILAAASGVRRDLYNQDFGRVVGLQLEGMAHVGFMIGQRSSMTPRSIKGSINLFLFDHRKSFPPRPTLGSKPVDHVKVAGKSLVHGKDRAHYPTPPQTSRLSFSEFARPGTSPGEENPQERDVEGQVDEVWWPEEETAAHSDNSLDEDYPSGAVSNGTEFAEEAGTIDVYQDDERNRDGGVPEGEAGVQDEDRKRAISSDFEDLPGKVAQEPEWDSESSSDEKMPVGPRGVIGQYALKR